MSSKHNVSRGLTLLTVLLTAASLVLAAPDPLQTFSHADAPQTDFPAKMAENRERRYEGGRSIHQDEDSEEEELFKDVDPKRLAAVLLEALNHTQVESRREEEEREEESRGEVQKPEANGEAGTMARSDRDGRRELELLAAARGKEGEREQEESKKAQEEEDRMTEKVTSRTTSHTVQTQPEPPPTSVDGGGDKKKDAAPQPDDKEEEQLSPEELKSLETMMKEFPRFSPVSKREGYPEPNQRESRGYKSYNDIIPIHKGGDLSKKKLKWQEETQKALDYPTFKGGNFMDDFEGNNNGGNTVQPPLPPQGADCEWQGDCVGEVEPEEEEEVEMLSPEEEEVQAKAEQEEMRRQAAEAQRAKMEEEKLADIASDMLLRYMVKQNNKKYSSPLSNAMEDKRSDEEVTEDDDIDPQTIDKLIEISSKLHLPADDVVDIISDVEKKKKKDVPPDVTSRRQQLHSPLPSAFSTVPQTSANQNSLPVSKQPLSAVKLLKSWFQEKMPSESNEAVSTNQDLWFKPHKPPKDLQPKLPKALWSSYPIYPYSYPSFYQRRPHYPIYFPPPPGAEPHYFHSKPLLSAGNFLAKSVDGVYPFPSQMRYRTWVQPQLRKPPKGLRPKSFYTPYPRPLYPRTFQPFPKPRSPPRMPVAPPQHWRVNYPAPARAVSRNRDYYPTVKQADRSGSHDDLERYIQQILLKRPQTTE